MIGGKATILVAATALALTALAGPATASATCRYGDSCDQGDGLGLGVGVGVGVGAGVGVGVGLGTCDDLLKLVVSVEGQERVSRARLEQDTADAAAARKALETALPADVAAAQARVVDADQRVERDKTEENRLLALVVKLKTGDCDHHGGVGCDRCHPSTTPPPTTTPPVTTPPVTGGNPPSHTTVILPPPPPPPIIVQAPPGPPFEVGTVPTGPVNTGDGTLAGQ